MFAERRRANRLPYEHIQWVGVDLPFVRARVFLLVSRGGGGKALYGFGAGRLSFAVHAAGCIVGTVL